MCRHDDDAETIATTAGRAIPGVEVLVVDDDGNEVAARRAGRGRRPRLQRDAGLRRRSRSAPRRRSTPTAGCTPATSACMDERGNLRITDRMKDMFIVGGFNAYPAEIENMIRDHPAVSPGRGRRRPRRSAWARSASRSSCRGPGQTVDADELDRVVPRAAWPTTRCRATSRSSTRSRSTRAARC